MRHAVRITHNDVESEAVYVQKEFHSSEFENGLIYLNNKLFCDEGELYEEEGSRKNNKCGTVNIL